MKRPIFATMLAASMVLTMIAVEPNNSAFAGETTGATDQFVGRYCDGTGDVALLRLLDESFAFFHASADVPNVTMIYHPGRDGFQEGINWGGSFWAQNGYGFSYAATPFLQEPWFSMLQHTWDLYWDNQGDGKRTGSPPPPNGNPDPLWRLVGPDGCLGDCVYPGNIAFKQGDGPPQTHDWFYEATAAGVVVQAEILLANRDRQAIAHYLPHMERACDFIERARDPKNNLFLVGPACNLLAPSYGGVKQPDGSFGKGYLAGLSITYLAGLDRMVELYKLMGDGPKIEEYTRRQKITRASLGLLLAPAGYFVKSIEPDGTKHGVLGQKTYGYLEGVANADAVALRVTDDATARSIYRQIAAYPPIRPFDFLLTNAPGLDDTYWSWGHTTGGDIVGTRQYGDWVNGGAWGTVEGRAILAYDRLNKFDDVRRSAERAMKWAKDFRMDAPWSQRGENTHNPWSEADGTARQAGGLAVMIDNFAIPAATIRGLFEYLYRSDRLILVPHVPPTISRYRQKEPVRFGGKRLFLTLINGGTRIQSLRINGKEVTPGGSNQVVLLYENLPDTATIEIVTTGGWDATPTSSATSYAATTPLAAASPGVELPESLRRPLVVLTAMDKLLASEPGAEYERAFVREALASIQAWRDRTTVQVPGFFRPMTPEKRAAILKFYETTALGMFSGFAKLMTVDYPKSPNAAKQHLAELYRTIP